MTTLYILGALMALIAILFVALPLLRTHKTDSAPAHAAANVAIYSDQLAELENDLSNRLISQAQFDLAKPELERRLLQDVPAGASASVAPTLHSTRWLGVTLAVLMPVLAVGIYSQLGAPEAIHAPAAQAPQDMVAQDEHSQQQEIEAILPRLIQHLQEQPDDIGAWQNLGRTMLALQRFEEAAKAFEKITEITPKSAQAFADYADALGMAQGQKLLGKPAQMIDKALKLEPKNPKALYLAGFVSIEAGNLKEGVKHWEKLLSVLPPEQRGVESLRQKIAELRQQAGEAGAQTPASATTSTESGAKASSSTATVSGQASLSATLQSQAAPEDTVFVFARAVAGPKMPLAMLRVKVKDLPVKFNLDDSMAMSPQMKLSNFPDVVIVARVSKGSTAIPQPGDLEGVSAPVKLGASNVKVEISRKIE